MQNKIGVISLYYKNYNYGGLLQAYALICALNNIGVNAKQISYDRSKETKVFSDEKDFSQLQKLRRKVQEIFLIKFPNYIFKKMHWSDVERSVAGIEQRNLVMDKFASSIPHTKVYDFHDIYEVNTEFNGFICGSDQIWNPSYLRDSYFLTFVEEGKPKIAYAASIGRDHLEQDEFDYIMGRIGDFTAISVRETAASRMLGESALRPIHVVLDPTLLLSRDEWNQVAEKYHVQDKYVFAYFLGDDVRQREAAIRFARIKHMTLVTFPNALGKYRKEDCGFGDLQIYDADPGQFISIIKSAEYIITDSFHACVFSTIFQKSFVAFERKMSRKGKNMNSRLYSFLELLGLKGQIVDLDDFLNQLKFPIPCYENCDDKLAEARIKSYSFLKKSLGVL